MLDGVRLPVVARRDGAARADGVHVDERSGERAPGRTGTRPGFRPDVQGLRALAVGLVVLYHLYPSVIRGGYVGVDVFFVISGYLITAHLARGLDRDGRIGLLDFWGRRARRLLPAASVVLLVTWGLSRWLLPITQLPAAEHQIRASALYFQNWVLAHDAVSYLHRGQAASPVEHFWSLSVEEQFYLVWPLLFAAAAAVGLRAARRARPGGAGGGAGGFRARHRTLLLLTAGVVAASLACSIVQTRTDPKAAYFVTTTRMWELGLGGLIALAPARLARRLSRAGGLAWAGLGLIVASALLLSADSAFPGWIALFPVAGAALMITSGSTEARHGPATLTARRPAVFVGDVSYSIYLWHWPLIVLWLAYSGGSIGPGEGAAVVAASVALAWLTKRFVEDPVRRARVVVRHPTVALATGTSVLVPALLVTALAVGTPAPFTGRLTASTPGAAVLANHTRAPNAPFVPPVAAVPADVPLLSHNGCEVSQDSATPTPCTFGDTSDPALKVALVGDSHAAQWSSALRVIAEREHWEVVGEVRAGCRWTPVVTLLDGRPYTKCHDWGAAVLNQLLTTVRPDVVIVTDRSVYGTVEHPNPGTAARIEMGQGLARYVSVLLGHGIQVVAIHETPELGVNVPDCLASRTGSIGSCGAPAHQALWPHTVVDAAKDVLGPRLPVVDMNDLLCTATTCPPVVGNVVVYRDGQHLAKTYSLTLAPYLRQRLLATGAFAP